MLNNKIGKILKHCLIFLKRYQKQNNCLWTNIDIFIYCWFVCCCIVWIFWKWGSVDLFLYVSRMIWILFDTCIYLKKTFVDLLFRHIWNPIHCSDRWYNYGRGKYKKLTDVNVTLVWNFDSPYNCKPNFIHVRENFLRYTRALLTQIFLATK